MSRAAVDRAFHANTDAETKLRAVVLRAPGWQRALMLPTRRRQSGALGPGQGGGFLKPNERTRHDVAALRAGRDTARHGVES